ncbi:MAG TPA: 6-carboxytetrahydropterin synthase [Acidobacteriaceae bacterium]|jgi:6-pyruvoyltetrahydropterin/6-carboxytetrahydropterin synthase|nr:6-carboxytetrahydropterin synthase [Acidobacteriaceae bacterium]
MSHSRPPETPARQPIAHLSRRYHFVASHRLHADTLSEEANRLTFGKCNNPFGHGHNYTAEITLSGPVDPQTGMVTNLADLDSFAASELLARFDHTNLNTVDPFRDLVPTTENLCLEIWKIFAPYPHATLRRVRVEETSNNSFEFSGVLNDV